MRVMSLLPVSFCSCSPHHDSKMETGLLLLLLLFPAPPAPLAAAVLPLLDRTALKPDEAPVPPAAGACCWLITRAAGAAATAGGDDEGGGEVEDGEATLFHATRLPLARAEGAGADEAMAAQCPPELF